jgi:hypothetical protein
MLAVLALLAPAGIASALPPPAAAPRSSDYPTWDEVQQARADAEAAAAMVATIGTLLDELQAESARLNDRALEQAAAAAAAESARDDAQATLQELERQATSAADRAELSSARAAQVVAAMVRSSGQDLTLVLLTNPDDGLLARLGMLDRLGGRLDAIIELAQFERNAARALAAQADETRALLTELAAEARTASDDAARAAATADAAVADQQAHLSELYEQLAALQGTSAEQERLYRVGQQGSNDPDDPGAGGSGGTGGGTDLGSIGDEYNNPAGAQAFAWAVFPQFGWTAGGDDQWCLTMLWNRESGWRTNAYNASSEAYGIPQSLPGSKMADVGADWRTNFRTQVLWGFYYIKNRYGSPCGAWNHSEVWNWY